MTPFALDAALASGQPAEAAANSVNNASSVQLSPPIGPPGSSPAGRILFGVAEPHEIDGMMEQSLTSGGVAIAYKWDPSVKAPLSLTQPHNISKNLRRSGTVRRNSKPPEPAVPFASAPAVTLSPKLVAQNAKPASPLLASASKAVSSASDAVITPSAAGPAVVASSPPSVLRDQSKGTANGRPSAALALTPDHAPLALGRSTSSAIATPSSSPTSSRTQQSPPPKAAAAAMPGVSFSRALRPPPSLSAKDAASIVYADERPAKAVKAAPKPAAVVVSSPSDTPLASSDAALSTAPTSPLLASSPPTRTTSPRPALKPKSWADLLRSPTSARKKVSIALPPSDDGISSPASSSSALPSMMSSPAQKPANAATEPVPPIIPVAPVQNPSHAPLIPARTAAERSAVVIQPNHAPAKRKLDDILKGVEHRHRAPPLQPRGLVNKGNQCFENSILQVLLYCAPFYNLLRLLGQETSHDFTDRFACLESMIAFVEEFTVGRREDLTSSQQTVYVSNGPHKPTVSDAFSPEMVYEALRGNKQFEAMMRGSQEDAQEFLGFLLDTLHEELLALIDHRDGKVQAQLNGDAHEASDDADGWLEVGSKGRTATTRATEGRESPISRIFAGKQRSTLRVPGQKDSATVQPFLTLQLEIQADTVQTIEDAIANICTTDTLSDYHARPGVRVEAYKQTTLEALPPILILHLKRFSYDADAEMTVKNHKVIGFETELDIAPAWLSPAAKQAAPIRYTLSAVVYHHGRNATGGHYTVSVRKQDGQWINIDDTTVRDCSPADVAVNRVQEVLRLSLPSAPEWPERSAYLLVWARTS